MAHEIATMLDGRAAMAYTGSDVPWHGLGQQLDVGASIETWAEQAGLNFTIAGADVLYQDQNKNLDPGSGAYRDDVNGAYRDDVSGAYRDNVKVNTLGQQE